MIDVLAVDPGTMTGLVLGQVPSPGVIVPRHWWELPQQEACDLIVDWCADRDGVNEAVVVVERFIPRKAKALTFVPASLEILGTARWAAKRYGVRFVTQSPSEKDKVRAFVTREFPGIGRGGEGHAKDALAHLYLFA